VIYVEDPDELFPVRRRRQEQLEGVVLVRECSLWCFDCGSLVFKIGVHGDNESVVCGH